MSVPDCHRMCLHAYKLSLPVLGGRVKTFVAPDPFAILSDDGGSKGHSRLVVAGENTNR